VNTAIQEDANAIALTSYQGGHMEYFKYMICLRRGTLRYLVEVEELFCLMKLNCKLRVTRIYAPDDGRSMGLQGMINDLVERSDYPVGDKLTDEVEQLASKNPTAIARIISAENFPEIAKPAMEAIHKMNETCKTPVLGITGTGGSGKSSLVDELVRRFLVDFPEKTIGLIL
jgi:methylmalonyl-CoA mutase